MFCVFGSDRAGNLTRTQATGAGVNLFGRAVYNSLNAFDVGFPSAVRATMRVGNLNTESNTFAAEITFSHVLHLLLIKQQQYLSRFLLKMQVFFNNL